MPFGVVFQVVLFPRENSEILGHVGMLRQAGDSEPQKEGSLPWLRFKTLGWPHNHTRILFWELCPLKSGSPEQQQKWVGVRAVAGSAPSGMSLLSVLMLAFSLEWNLGGKKQNKTEAGSCRKKKRESEPLIKIKGIFLTHFVW